MKLAVERLKEIETILRQKWPAAFSKYQPLAKGCHAEVIAAFPDVPKQDLLRTLNAWTHHPDYLKGVMTRRFRITLDGRLAHAISEQDRVYASMQYQRYMHRQRARKTANRSSNRGYAILYEEYK